MRKIITSALQIWAILSCISCAKKEVSDLETKEAIKTLIDSTTVATLPSRTPRIEGEGSEDGYLINCSESVVDWYQQTYVRYSDGTTGGYSGWQYTHSTVVSRLCEPIWVGSGSGGSSGGGSSAVSNGYVTPLSREEGTSGATPSSPPAAEADLSKLYGFGGASGGSDDGRLSCQSFKFTPVGAGANSQEAGIRGLKFVASLFPSGATVRTFSFRTLYVNMGIQKKDGTIITPGMAAEYAAAAANRAGASLTLKYLGKSLQEINALQPAVVEREFRKLFEVILQKQEIKGYVSVLFNASSGSSPIVSDPVWNGTVTQVFNWLSGKGCAE